MTKSFDGKVAVITGAGSGIGAQIASAYARAGGMAVIVDLDAANGNRTAGEITEAGLQAKFVQADAADRRQVGEAVAFAARECGGIDVLVNNAGIDFKKGLRETTDEEWDRVMNVNLKSVFLMSRECAPWLEKSEIRSIVNISSVHALQTIAGADAYAAAKGGVLSLTRSMALSLQREGIRVNAVCPGYVPTPMWGDLSLGNEAASAELARIASFHPAGKLGTPEDIAKLVLFLASPDAAFINGQTIAADGGITVRLLS